ncbi:MAG TPA: hypothetical protein VN969_07850 [Streptosporangiaceae bacterium]|nr:hypothetical protein [Streptosporangiaceae bacterium]
MTTNLTVPKWFPAPSVRRTLRAEQDVIAAITARLRERRAAPHAASTDMLDVLVADPSLVEDDVVAVSPAVDPWMTTALFRTAGRSSARSCACTRRPG